MKAGILPEFPAFCTAIYGGLIIGAVYDLFRLLRIPFASKWVQGGIDLLYYAVAGAIAAMTMLYINGGMLRMYIFLGLGLGIYAYTRFPGRIVKFSIIKAKAKFTKK